MTAPLDLLITRKEKGYEDSSTSYKGCLGLEGSGGICRGTSKRVTFRGLHIKEENNKSHTSSFCKKNKFSRYFYPEPVLRLELCLESEVFECWRACEGGGGARTLFVQWVRDALPTPLPLTLDQDGGQSTICFPNGYTHLAWFFISLSVHVPLLEVTHLVAVVVVGEKARRGAISGRLKKIVLKNQLTRFPSWSTMVKILFWKRIPFLRIASCRVCAFPPALGCSPLSGGLLDILGGGRRGRRGGLGRSGSSGGGRSFVSGRFHCWQVLSCCCCRRQGLKKKKKDMFNYFFSGSL